MAMDPNSPSYIKEETYRADSFRLAEETIHFESHLSRGITDTSVVENAPSLGVGKWVYKGYCPNSYDITNISTRNSLRKFSPSTDSNTVIALPLGIPNVNNETANFNHTVDLTYRPSINISGGYYSESDIVMNGKNTLVYSSSECYVLDFWFKVPTFNTSIFYIPGWFDYLYESEINGNGIDPRLGFYPQHILIGVTDCLNGQKRLICEISRIFDAMYISSTEWYKNLGEELNDRSAIFFIDNGTPLNSGDWHHLVIKTAPFALDWNYRIPSFRVWLDDDLVFTAFNIGIKFLGVGTPPVYPLLDDTQNILNENGSNPEPRFAFALSNKISENTYYQMHLFNPDSYVSNTVYGFNAGHFPSITDTSKVYIAPDALMNYSDLFDASVSNTEELEFKDLKYSSISFKILYLESLEKNIYINLEVGDKSDISEDLFPINIDTAKDIDPVDIPLSIDIREDISEDLFPINIDTAKDITPVDIPLSIDIREDISKDLLNPITLDIGKDITPVDMNIYLTTSNPFKSLEEVEDYINKTYLGNKQAADDFQLLMKVTDTSYWPVEFSIDNNYHIHIKPDPIYLGVPLYASTNKQFLYGKYVLNDD